jgi:hypothetical protein
MAGRVPPWQKIPVPVYVGTGVGGCLGVLVGGAMCLGYDLAYGPWFPQAGVDPQPAGWIGWWRIAGAAGGAIVGAMLAGALVGIWRLFKSSSRAVTSTPNADEKKTTETNTDVKTETPAKQ